MKIRHTLYGLIQKIKSILAVYYPTTKISEPVTTFRLYQSIHKLPLNIWMDCLVNSEIDKLIIEGVPTYEELKEGFSKLYLEYVTASGGKDAVKQMANTARIKARESRLKLFEFLCDAIKTAPSAELYQLFYKFPLYQPLAIEYSVENVEKQIKSMLPYYNDDLIRYMNENDALNTQQGKDAPTHYTYDYFYKVITEIESAFKVSISDTITVGKFTVWINKYKDYVTKMELKKI